MKCSIVALVLAFAVPGVAAQEVRSKVAPPSEKAALTNIINPDKTVYGAPWGTDEAIKAVREMVFLPAVKDGMFVTTWLTTEASFNIR